MKKREKEPTFDVGLSGWIRTHLERVFPFAAQVSQSKPASHWLLAEQVSPICLSSSTYSKEIKIIIIIIIITTTTCSILVLLYLVYKEWILKVGIWREKLTKGKHACVPGDRRNRQRDKLWWRWTQLGFWCSWWWSLFSELIQKQK